MTTIKAVYQVGMVDFGPLITVDVYPTVAEATNSDRPKMRQDRYHQVQALLDTGGSDTIVDIATARAMGLKQVGTNAIVSVTGSADANPLFEAFVRFDPMKEPVLIKLGSSALPRDTSPRRIIIGRPFLARFLCFFDFSGGTYVLTMK